MNTINTSYKSASCILFFIFYTLVSFGQSKKEQIAILSSRLDSLNLLLAVEQSDFKIKERNFKFKLDSLESRVNSGIVELENIRKGVKSRKVELEILKDSIATIKKALTILTTENAKLNTQLDSLFKRNDKEVKLDMKIDMVFVEGGQFNMGSNTGGLNEKPVHSVKLSSFYIGKYEITQEQWQAVMGTNPSKFNNCKNCPVENVSRHDVQLFIKELQIQTGMGYCLPTEAQWEYAARGGKRSKGYKYSGSNELDAVGWFSLNSDNKTHIVGTKRSNELGIFDMSGNVHEWCLDLYSEQYLNVSAFNPTGPLFGRGCVIRGGNFLCAEVGCVNSRRGAIGGSISSETYGFRLALPVKNE
jgi:formylglycine-generating enzyme required for sulfatase activity